MQALHNNHRFIIESPPKSDYFSFDGVTYCALNILTLGFYAVYKNLAYTHQIKKLEEINKHLETSLQARVKKWTELESHLEILRNSLTVLDRQSFDLSIKKLEAMSCVVIKVDQDLSETPFNFTACVALLAINYLSLGLFAFYRHKVQQKENASLINQMVRLQDSLKDNHELEKKTRFQDELKLTRKVFNLEKENHLLASPHSNPINQSPSEFYKQLEVQQAQLRNEKALLLAKLRDIKKNLASSSSRQEEIELEQARAKKSISTLQIKLNDLEMEMKSIHESLEGKEDKIKKANEEAEQTESLAEQKASIDKTFEFIKSVQKLHQQKLGPLPRVYAQRLSDGPLPAIVPDKSIPHKKLWYEKLVHDKRSAAEIVQCVYMNLLERFKIKGVEIAPDHIFRLVVLDLIQGASLEQTCQNYVLKLNDYVSMTFSNPVRGQSVRHNANNEKEPYVKIYQTAIDEFTTDLTIEPDSIRWIISNRLNLDDLGALKFLLRSKVFGEAGCPGKLNKEKKEFIEQAHQLICTLGSALETKFKHG